MEMINEEYEKNLSPIHQPHLTDSGTRLQLESFLKEQGAAIRVNEVAIYLLNHIDTNQYSYEKNLINLSYDILQILEGYSS